MYLDLTLGYFSRLFSLLTLVDEHKIIEKIVKYGHFLLSKFWHDTNINFFYEFFDLFDTVNSSVCYQNVATKPKFGLYHGPCPTLTVIHF